MPFIPLRDRNPLNRIPFQYVTLGLIVLCLAVFAYQMLGLSGPRAEGRFIVGFAMIPSVISAGEGPPPSLLAHSLGWGTLVSYAFLHADWLHLLGNMLFLWVFGDNVEDALGHLRFLGFYLAAAVLAALAHLLLDPASTVPLVGASGAIAGVLGGYLVLHPRATVWILLLWRIPLPVPAWLAIGGWAAFQTVMMLGVDAPTAPGANSVAWGAHIGGFAAGAAIMLALRPRLAQPRS